MKDKFCLTSVMSFNDVNKYPVNNSTSKNLWSFGKDHRFHKEKVLCDSFYELNQMKPNKYGVSIGKGKKLDFTKDYTVSPASTRYQIKSFADSNKDKAKGYSIGLSREKIIDRSYIQLDPLKVPGPGAYTQKLARSTSYSFRTRTKLSDRAYTLESQNQNPGPGAYENPEALNASGNYPISKHSGSGATKFNPKKSERFSRIKTELPGPGSYKIPSILNDSTKIADSKFIGTGSRAFSTGKRHILLDTFSKYHEGLPGPGSYRLPSDFGYYDGDIYSRRRLKTENK